VDETDGRLTCRGRSLALTPKAFEVLVYLLRRHPRLVTRDELLDAAWPDCCVSDGTLTSTIWMVRRALSNSGAWIETIPKRGYRFVGAVKSGDPSIDSAGHAALPSHRAAAIEAYQQCLAGRHHCHSWPTSTFHRSRELFERAIRLDPTSAAAHFGLALYHGIGAAMGLLRPVEGWRQFQRSLLAARSLDPALAENYNGIAAEHLYLHRDWEQAERAFTRGLEIAPDEAETRNHYGFSLALFGRVDEAIAHIGRAIHLDPLSMRFRWNLAFVLYQSCRYDEAIEQCQLIRDVDATYLHAYVLMGDSYEQKGELFEALRHWQLAEPEPLDVHVQTVDEFWRARLRALERRRRHGGFVPAMDVARVHARLGNIDDTLASLTRALHEPSRLVLELPLDPRFEQLRGHREFDALVAALPNAHAARVR
jgi:DNA-binding winged helix-turn-helix (wHTH) protein